MPPAVPQPHLQDDYVIVTERAELVTPSGIMADDLIDDILEVQGKLLHCQVLALGIDGRELGVAPTTPRSWVTTHGLHHGYPPACLSALAWAVSCGHGDQSPQKAGRSCHPQTLGRQAEGRSRPAVLLGLPHPRSCPRKAAHHPQALSLPQTATHSATWCN
jgi:hypothetical protein